MSLAKANQDGVTLIELMVVIAIIAILAGMAFMSAEMIRKERVSSTTRNILADLQRMRVDGMVTGPSTTTMPFMRGSGIRFVNNSSYVTFRFNDCSQNFTYDANGCSGSREEVDAQTIKIPSGVILRINQGGLINPSDHIVMFDRFGYPRSSSWGMGITTIVVSHQTVAFNKCVSISTSRIREGQWNESTTSCEEQ